MPTDKQIAANIEIFASERAYRRGYHQGVCAVLDAIDGNASLEQLNGFEQEVKDWRERPAFMMSPPAIPSGAKPKDATAIEH